MLTCSDNEYYVLKSEENGKIKLPCKMPFVHSFQYPNIQASLLHLGFSLKLIIATKNGLGFDHKKTIH